MKICVISNMYPSKEYPYRGIFVKRVVDELERNGFDIDLITMKQHPLKLISYISWWWECIWKLGIRRSEYQIVHAHFVKYAFIPFLLLPRRILRKTVFNFHGTDFYVRGILFLLMKYILGKTALIISPSFWLKDKIADRFGFSGQKISVFPSGGVDTTFFRPETVSYDDTANSPVLRLGYLSSIIGSKGWRVLLDALMLLVEKGISFKCVFAGDGEDVPQLKEMIKKENLFGSVVFEGRKEGREIVSFLNSLDIFVFPSERESLGLVGLEAMACGVPVIGSRIGGIGSYLNHMENGLSFQAGNPEDLFNAILQFIDLNEEARSGMKEKARKTAEKYDSKTVFQSLVNDFLSIADN